MICSDTIDNTTGITKICHLGLQHCNPLEFTCGWYMHLLVMVFWPMPGLPRVAAPLTALSREKVLQSFHSYGGPYSFGGLAVT